MFKWLWNWILNWFGKQPPSKLLKLEYNYMDAVLNWTLPVPNSRQSPLLHVLIEGRLAGIAEWTAINTVDIPGTSLTIQDIVPGSWEFRGSVVDTELRVSAPLQATLIVPTDGPSSLETFSATLV